MSLDGHSIQVQLWGFNPTPGVLGDPGVGPVPAGRSGGGACACWGILGRGLCLLRDLGVEPMPALTVLSLQTLM